MTPVEKCFIHRLIDSFTEFLFERLMGDHGYFGLCRGCTVAKQNFLEHLGVLTVGRAKLPLHFLVWLGGASAYRDTDGSGRVLPDQILGFNLSPDSSWWEHNP